jgi:hypothetical protein
MEDYPLADQELAKRLGPRFATALKDLRRGVVLSKSFIAIGQSSSGNKWSKPKIKLKIKIL